MLSGMLSDNHLINQEAVVDGNDSVSDDESISDYGSVMYIDDYDFIDTC